MRPARILIIDDDPRYLELLQFSLEDEGFAVKPCTTSANAVSTALEFAPDVILSDVSMPDLDGFRLALDFRAEPATALTPLIFLTARGQQADVYEGRSVGAVEYITKPFSPKQLGERIRMIIRKHTSLEATS
jgi:DNA-binding response OmpR family regulator